MPKLSLPEVLPKHIAVVMDGNGRWAKKRLLPRTAGHRAGVKRLKALVHQCGDIGIEVLTVFAFSSENWRRPSSEVGFLMKLFVESLQAELKDLHKNNVKIRFIGDRSELDLKLLQVMQEAESVMQDNTGLQFNVAFNYGGQWEILQAAKILAARVHQGELAVDEIDEQAFSECLTTYGQPMPDLFIRTSGEVRISNFLLWQLAYSELYFTETPWPAFDDQAFHQALRWYADRQRRFGKISEQVEDKC